MRVLQIEMKIFSEDCIGDHLIRGGALQIYILADTIENTKREHNGYSYNMQLPMR